MADIESPIVLSEAQKKDLRKVLDDKKKKFDEKLVKLMMAEDMIVVPELSYTKRGIFATLNFEPMTTETRKMMEERVQ